MLEAISKFGNILPCTDLFEILHLNECDFCITYLTHEFIVSNKFISMKKYLVHYLIKCTHYKTRIRTHKVINMSCLLRLHATNIYFTAETIDSIYTLNFQNIF